MPEFKFSNILLPIDLSHPSSWEKALPVAIDMARMHGAKLHVLTVIPDVGLPVVGSFFPADFEEKARRKAEKALREWLAEHVPEDIEAEGYVSVGAIYHRILRAAEKTGADLIIMASHRPEMKDYLLGPNAARVARHARQHVFIVRS
jgi:nucleotide-binding universal stress UspA family protein